MKKITILDQANVPQGPFAREQVAEKLQRGEFTLDSLAFVEGLMQWTPLRDVLVRIDASAAPLSGALPTPPASLSTTSPTYSYAVTMQPPSHLVYGGFWIRTAAYLIDGLLLTAVLTIVAMVAMIPCSILIASQNEHSGSGQSEVSTGVAMAILVLELVLYAVMFLAIWFYFAYFESSVWQATLGKRLLGLQVVGLDGNRIGFWRATGRFFGKYISTLILNIGYMMAGWSERKQGLHDMIAGTLVVRK